MPIDVFIGPTATPQTRFASLTTQLNLAGFYSGESLSSLLAAYGGTVPELWNYTYGRGYTFYRPVVTRLPFRGRKNVTNWTSIPRDWGGPA